MAFPEDLLEQAQHLARREPKRPKQASLRRAVSAAYYALFHLLIAEATRNWKRAAQRHSLGRAFDHGQMRTACEKKRKELTAYLNGDPSPSPQRVLSQHLHTVTDTFIQLQQQRQTADYDSGGPEKKYRFFSRTLRVLSEVGKPFAMTIPHRNIWSSSSSKIGRDNHEHH